MFARFQYEHYFVRGEDRRDRKDSAGESLFNQNDDNITWSEPIVHRVLETDTMGTYLPQNEDIRFAVIMINRNSVARAPKASLDFISDQEDIVLFTQLLNL